MGSIDVCKMRVGWKSRKASVRLRKGYETFKKNFNKLIFERHLMRDVEVNTVCDER